MPLQRHGFVLLPRFSLLALSGAVEALGAANELLGERCHQVLTLSLDGQPVRAGCGTLVAVAQALPDAGRLDALHVVSDQPLPDPGGPQPLHQALRAHAAAGATLAGIGTGAAVLAAAGVLAGHRATLHWAHVPQLAEQHADVVFSSNVYEIDRGRLSCAGAGASLDMMIAWLAQRHGQRIGEEMLAHFGLERLRARDERQRTPAAARIGGGSAKLAEAVALMEANLGEPLATEDIAQLVGVSRRQLERLFKQHLDALPSRWYAELRLARARRLLQQTSQSILQIGLSCGFASGSHFSNAYRARFGHTPREERSQRAAAWRDHPEETAS
jgi:transcriptional regulator GlxA family with amidase domain